MSGPFDELVGSRMTDPDERQAGEITRKKGKNKKLTHKGSVSEESAGLYLGVLKFALVIVIAICVLLATKYGIEAYTGQPISKVMGIEGILSKPEGGLPGGGL